VKSSVPTQRSRISAGPVDSSAQKSELEHDARTADSAEPDDRATEPESVATRRAK
jgi:hypothetical protein